MYCYSDNGLSFRSVDSSYAVRSGEVAFPGLATPTQLAAAFPNYAAQVANAGILQQIDALENQTVTERMKQEAITGSANTFKTGPYAGKTSAQAMASIRAQIDTLRAQLTS
jgi:hypothetical protein